MDKLLGTGEWVPKEMSESESSDKVGESAGSGRRRPDPGWCILGNKLKERERLG